MEGDHGSSFFYPDSLAGQAVIAAQVQLQTLKGGSPNRGRSLHSYFAATAFESMQVSPRFLYVDGQDEGLGYAFVTAIFVPMLEAIGPQAIAEGIITAPLFRQGIQDLYAIAATEGLFCYTFFKAFGIKG